MKLGNLIVVPVLAGAVVYGGLKGYVYYKVKGGMEDLTRLAAPFVTIKYKGITSDLGGKIGIQGVRLTPVGTTLDFNIGEVEIEGPNSKFLLAVANGFKGKNPPRYAYFRIRDAKVPVGSDMLEQLNQLTGLDPTKAKEQLPPVCSLGGIFQRVGIENIGFEHLSVDLSFGYKLYQRSNEMEIDMGYNAQGVESVDMVMMLKGVTEFGPAMMSKMPTLGRVDLKYNADKGFMNEMVDYCAQKQEITPEEFVNGLFNQSDYYYAKNLGFVPGAGIKDAIRMLVTDAGNVSFKAYPTTDLSVNSLSRYKPQDMMSLMGVTMQVNGKDVLDMSYTVPTNIASLRGDGEGGIDRPMEGIGERRNLKPKKYVKTNIGTLHKHVGKEVRLHMRQEGLVKKGTLDSIKNSIVSLEQRIYGGTFTSHVSLNDVRYAEVLRRE